METSSLALSNSLIFSVIFGQNGTIEKSIAELAMNSGDAGATEFVVDVTSTKITVSDNGKGFLDKQQIKEWWATLGFEHNTAETQRMYGKYGMGRAQIMAFGSSVWHTNGFTMSIDVKNNGLEYVLKENQPVHQGLKIEVDLYTPMTTKEIFSLRDALSKQLKYFPLEIRFNGEVININPFEQKWSYETPQFWLKGKFIEKADYRNSVDLYNIGVFVRSVYASNYVGFSGEIISKPGHAFNLNISRDAVLTQQCELHDELMKFLRANSPKASEVKAKKTTLTKEQRIEVLNSIPLEDIGLSVASDGWTKQLSTATSSKHGVADVYNQKLIPLLDGNLSLYQAFRGHGIVLVTDVVDISREKERTLKEAYPNYHFTELKLSLLKKVVEKIGKALEWEGRWKEAFIVVNDESEVAAAKEKAFCVIFEGISSLTGKAKGIVCKPKDVPEAVRAAMLYLFNPSFLASTARKVGIKERISTYDVKVTCGIASTEEKSWLSGHTVVIDAKYARSMLSSGFPGFIALKNEVLFHVIDFNLLRSDLSAETKEKFQKLTRLIACEMGFHRSNINDFKRFISKCLERNVKPFSSALTSLAYFENLEANQNLFMDEELVDSPETSPTGTSEGDADTPLMSRAA